MLDALVLGKSFMLSRSDCLDDRVGACVGAILRSQRWHVPVQDDSSRTSYEKR